MNHIEMAWLAGEGHRPGRGRRMRLKCRVALRIKSSLHQQWAAVAAARDARAPLQTLKLQIQPCAPTGPGF
jgi:hypothetical protein